MTTESIRLAMLLDLFEKRKQPYNMRDEKVALITLSCSYHCSFKSTWATTIKIIIYHRKIQFFMIKICMFQCYFLKFVFFFSPTHLLFSHCLMSSIGKEARSWIVDKFIWPHWMFGQCWIEMEKIHHIMLKLRHIKLKYILEGQDTPIEKKETSNWI